LDIVMVFSSLLEVLAIHDFQLHSLNTK
jgi:hypothetical protein